MNVYRKTPLCLIFVCLVSVTKLAAQAPDEKTDPIALPPTTTLRTLPHDVINDFKHLPSRDSLWILGIGGALALSVHPADKDVNGPLSDDHGTFKAGKAIGNTGTLVGVSMLAWGVGKMTGNNA